MIAVDASPLVWTPRGGVARSLLHVLEAWEREGLPSPVQLLAPSVPSPSLAAFAPALFEIVQTPAAPPASPAHYRAWLARHLQALRPEALWVPWSAFPRVTCPVVVTVHELPFVRHGPIEGRVRTWRHRRWLRRAVDHCAAIVTPSDATRDDLLGLHPEAGPRVHTIPNGFDPRPWQVARRGPCANVPRDRRPLGVAVGTGAGAAGPRKKGIDVLFDAAQHVRAPGFEVVLVGAWKGPGRPRIRAVGALEDAELRALLGDASMLLHPARSEGFGYPPLEAMAADVPVICSDGGALPEITGDAALRVPAGSAEALAEAIDRLLGDPTLSARLVAAGRIRAEAFPPAASAERLTSLFATLSAVRGRSA